MRARFLLLAGFGLAFAGNAEAQAQTTWSDVRCEQAELSFVPGFRCRQSSVYRYGDSSVTGHSAAVVGEVNGFLVNITMLQKQGNFSLYSKTESEALVRKYIAGPQPPVSHVSAYREAGNGGYLTFAKDNKACVGFDAPVGKFHDPQTGRAGVSFIIRGYFCADRAFANPQQEAVNVMASLRIGGARQNKNAFGEPVRPHPRFPPAQNAAAPKHATPAAADGASRTEADLAAAKSLYEKNLITREEYDARRKAILSRL